MVLNHFYLVCTEHTLRAGSDSGKQVQGVGSLERKATHGEQGD